MARFPDQVQRTTNDNGRTRRSFDAGFLDGFCDGRCGARTWNETLQLDRILGSAALCAGEDELLRIRFQYRDHVLKLLVRHGAENDPHTSRIKLLEKRPER